ncbi:hypothetical protein [Grimontia sp. NTOU-MAR1]|uniref:hypothetical protein n=1 Tax=Grimontia sp. NTOU-MAR1 TaxID=3111011 RepID=UPI002DBEAE81|nr:hypothetical protein [Grimontia sp. NTOU-MAR1]WRW00815.1 hypothetical protein VP504_20430 [Grimontia sp. NTOU-MAR1]
MPALNVAKRYQSAELRDKLAAEYVIGTLTPRVQRRLESLMNQDPSWWEYIEHWQQHFAAFTPSIDANVEWEYTKPPERVWHNIVTAVDPQSEGSKVEAKAPWWKAITMPLSLAFSLVIGVLISPNIMPPEAPKKGPIIVQPANYFALMSSEQEHNLFAIVAYLGLGGAKSTLRLQRNLRESELPPETATVWMRDKATGNIIRIDTLRNINDTRFLSPAEWQQLKNSSELIVTIGETPRSQVLYRGRCVELSNWNAI